MTNPTKQTADRIDALEAENEGAMALIAAERGEVIALRAENARLREVLESISTYRKRCHDYDSDVGHEMRDFDREDVRLLEIEARAALKGGM